MKRLFIILLCSVATGAGAQNTAHHALSLQQAIDTGLANRYDVQANKYNISLADNTLKKSRQEWLPDIHVDGNIRYNMQMQATFIPPGFGGLDKPELLALGAKNATILGIELQQPVLQPMLATDIKIAKNSLELQQEKNRGDEIKIKVQIATAYYNVLLKNLQQAIAGRDETRFREYYTLAEGKYKQGALIETDYLRAQLDYANARITTASAQQNYQLAMNELKYQVNIPVTDTITLTDTLGTVNAVRLPAADSYLNRTEIRQIKLLQQDNQLQLRKAQQYAIPTVSVTGNYSRQYLYNDFKYTQGEWWTPFSYVGLKLSVPISGNIKNRHQIRNYELKALQTTADLEQKTADVQFEILQAATELNNALLNMQTTRKNFDLSEKIYQQQQLEFSLGSFAYNNLLETERSISNVEQQYIKTQYDYLLAQIKYNKATGSW
ncbi:TolC family protein [Chitinophaga arvensicola]|uniref:Outer membrane protein TolC n=1 Tax=Chitinophaga arvensicola TaxID=29529 RepID=A0A1I0S917_9BACT|nr:TolC family protein [Chitinophaga arvensicola]SEW52613.1 Outer membrane protein TolC [Chitinophaga arvensicola]